MEKRGRGRSPKASPFNQEPEFFEVFLPNRISDQLRVPPDFVKHFDQNIPEIVIVKDLSGSVWHVDLKQEENGVFLKNGWNKFVTDKCLKLGEFMVFRYNKRSASFTVRIFGLNACKKDEYNDSEKPFTYVKDEEESDQDSAPIRKCSRSGAKRVGRRG